MVHTMGPALHLHRVTELRRAEDVPFRLNLAKWQSRIGHEGAQRDLQETVTVGIYRTSWGSIEQLEGLRAESALLQSRKDGNRHKTGKTSLFDPQNLKSRLWHHCASLFGLLNA